MPLVAEALDDAVRVAVLVVRRRELGALAEIQQLVVGERVRVEADDKLVSNEAANSDCSQEVDGVLS